MEFYLNQYEFEIPYLLFKFNKLKNTLNILITYVINVYNINHYCEIFINSDSIAFRQFGINFPY